LTPAERLDIYAGMYVYRLQEALAVDFPAVAHALGHDAFWSLTREYVRDRPSRYFNLNAYSAAFPAYVAGRRDVKYHDFLGELATLEWAMVDVVHARSSEPRTFAHLAGATAEQWEGARFALAPAVRLFAFEHPVNIYYQAYRDGKHPAIPRRDASWLAVQRRGFVVWRLSLTRARFAALSALARGKTLRQALEAVLRAKLLDAGSLEKALFRWFQEWTSDGLFDRIEIPAVVKGSRAQLFGKYKGGVRVKDRGRVRRDAGDAVLTSRSEAAAAR
jgi:hypothetical protein